MDPMSTLAACCARQSGGQDPSYYKMRNSEISISTQVTNKPILILPATAVGNKGCLQRQLLM